MSQLPPPPSSILYPPIIPPQPYPPDGNVGISPFPAPDTPPVPPYTSDAQIPQGSPTPVAPVQFTQNYYRESDINCRYDFDEGVLAVPVAGDPNGPPTCEVVRMHNPMCMFIVEATAERVGAPPLLPSWITNNPNLVPYKRSIMGGTPAIGPDGTAFIRRTIRYEFICIQAPGINDPLPVGTTPYTTIPSVLNNIQPSDFDQSLLDCSSGIPAGFVPPVQ